MRVITEMAQNLDVHDFTLLDVIILNLSFIMICDKDYTFGMSIQIQLQQKINLYCKWDRDFK